MLWLQFLICTSLIIISGYRLTVYADAISEKTKLSSGLMGIVILAFITSCPELVTALSSITVVGAPDLAIGDLLGADIFNILAIALLGILCGRGSILRGQNRTNIFTATLVVVMLLVITASLTLRRFTDLPLGILNIGFASILLGLIYIGGVTLIYKKELHVAKPHIKGAVTADLLLKFIMSALVIIASAVWLANIGKNISVFYHLNEMYVGVLLIAFATTMPEFVVSLTALKQNSISMATGNLLGSNIFNLFIIAILDVVLRKGEFLSYVSGMNIFPALFAIALTAIAIIAMFKKSGAKNILPHLAWDSAIIIVVFFVGHYLLFYLVSTVK